MSTRPLAALAAVFFAQATLADVPATTGQQPPPVPQPPCSQGPGTPGCDPTPTTIGPHSIAAAVGATQTCTSPFNTVRSGSLARSANFPRDAFRCPTGNQFRMLDNRFPPAAVFVNYVRNPANASVVQSLIEKVHNASPGTQVNVMVPEADLARAQADLGAAASASHVRLIPTRAGVSFWAQDTHEFGVVDGRPAVLDLPTDIGRGEHIPRSIADSCIGSNMRYIHQPCLTTTSQYCRDHLKPRDQRQPGDLLCASTSGPEWSCMESLNDYVSLLNLPRQNEAEKARVRARIAMDYPTCGGEALERSVSRSSNGMWESFPDRCCPNTPATQDDDLGGNIEAAPGGIVMVGAGINSGIVSFLRAQGNEPLVMESADLLAVGHVDELFNVVPTARPAPCNFALMVARPSKGIQLLTQELARGSSGRTMRVGGPPIERNPRTVEQLLNDQDFLSKNALIDSFIQQDQRRLLQKLHERSGCTDVPVVEMPLLLAKGTWTRSMGENRDLRPESADRRQLMDDLAMSGTESILPNSVNSVSIGTTQIMPDPQFRPFRNYIESATRGAGITADFIRDTPYHNNMGEIHCGTNVVRTCNPLQENPYVDGP